MDYKSSRSDKFRIWLNTMTLEKMEKLVLLEKHARLLVHRYDLIGETDRQDVHNLARVTKLIQEEYERE